LAVHEKKYTMNETFFIYNHSILDKLERENIYLYQKKTAQVDIGNKKISTFAAGIK
jgi:hypothetical protein